MLKRFFISMLGAIAGFWLSTLLVSIGLFAVIGAAFALGESDTKVSDNSILYLNLEGEIVERQQPQGLIDFIKEYKNEVQSLDQIINAVRMAADDKKIAGIYINAAGSSMGVASREELLSALNVFKESGKWIYAYGDMITQGDYLIASVADKVFVNPVGNVDIRGIGTSTPFFAGLLDKLGIKVQVVKVGTYKSAVEPFILTSMSDAARHQNQVFVDSIWDFYAGTIAANRNVSAARVSAWADSLTFAWTAERDVEADIVTETRYRRNVEDMLRDLTGTDSDSELPLVSPAGYMASKSVKAAPAFTPHVAVLYAVGDIVDSGDEGIVGDKMVPQIVKLADDDDVTGLVLRVNSGGGSAFASEQIWEALEYFKSKGKPFYVSMGDYAASGGYYISCGADSIYADATTLTGSIGVFGMIPDISGFITGKLGVTFSTVASSPNATFMSLTEPMTPFQRNAMQQYVETTYDTFTSRVAEGRHISVDSVKAIAEGRVWVGSSAIAIGLVDEIGTLHDAIAEMTSKLGLEPSDWVAYPDAPTSFLERLAEETASMQASFGGSLDPEAVRYLMLAKRLTSMSPVQARMPEIVIR